MYVFSVTSMHIVIYLFAQIKLPDCTCYIQLQGYMPNIKNEIQPWADKLSLQQDKNGDMKGGNTHPRSHGLDGGGGTYCKSP